MLGYLMYGTMHFAIHAWNPPFRWMKPLWRNHHLHHYKDEEKGFGVSSTFWDHVFGTMFDLKKEKEDKEKVAELMFVEAMRNHIDSLPEDARGWFAGLRDAQVGAALSLIHGR